VPTAAVGAVVVSWNGEDLLPSCLDSLLAQTVAANLEVVVVDHASEEGTAATLAKRYQAVTSLPAGPNLRFAGGADLGVAGFAGEFVTLPNNDATFAVDAIERMISVVQRRDVCVIQPARHRDAVFDPPRLAHQKVRRPPHHPRGPTTTKDCPLSAGSAKASSNVWSPLPGSAVPKESNSPPPTSRMQRSRPSPGTVRSLENPGCTAITSVLRVVVVVANMPNSRSKGEAWIRCDQEFEQRADSADGVVGEDREMLRERLNRAAYPAENHHHDHGNGEESHHRALGAQPPASTHQHRDNTQHYRCDSDEGNVLHQIGWGIRNDVDAQTLNVRDHSRDQARERRMVKRSLRALIELMVDCCLEKASY
jgi:glycosyltransferase involved in cell wall biosynthesis